MTSSICSRHGLNKPLFVLARNLTTRNWGIETEGTVAKLLFHRRGAPYRGVAPLLQEGHTMSAREYEQWRNQTGESCSFGNGCR
jgi:hypothetical protein